MPRQEYLVVDSRLETLFKVQRWLKDIYLGLDPEFHWVNRYRDRLTIAVTEGYTNAVRHAHAALPPETPISIEIALDNNRVDIFIWDQGDPFDPSNLGEPEPGALLQEGGYGWFLLRRLTDNVTYFRRNDKNCLAITQFRTSPASLKAAIFLDEGNHP